MINTELKFLIIKSSQVSDIKYGIQSVYLPLTSICLMAARISLLVIWKPRPRSTFPISSELMLLSPFLSNNSNISCTSGM